MAGQAEEVVVRETPMPGGTAGKGKKERKKKVKTDEKTEEEKRRMEERKKRLQQKLCLLYTSPSPRDRQKSRMPSSA